MRADGGWRSALRKLLGCLGLALLFALPPATAETEYIEVVANGRGVTADEAINNAIAEAVRRINGTHVDARQSTSVRTEGGSVSNAEGESASFSYSERVDASVSTTARGAISSYEVISQNPGAHGVDVRIRARAPRYRAPGIDSGNRRKLAVIPFSSRLGQIEFFGSTYGEELAAELSQAILTQFVQSRRFAILDRESWGAIQNEQRILASALTPIEEKAKLGAMLGADYLVLGELLDAAGGMGVRTERLTGVQHVESGGHIALSYRIVVPATGEIKFADTLEIGVLDPQGRAFQSRTGALVEMSKRLVGIATDRIYPIQVVNVSSPNSVVLNQGGATLSMGDRLILVELGDAMVDPYTKEPLGRVESEVGLLEINRVDGKVAYANLVGSASAALRVGMLARRNEGLYAAGAQAPVPPPSPRTEGVVLPFDR